MKKLTKKQEKQLRAVDRPWQKAGNIDLRIIILFVLSILDNKLEETLKRIEIVGERLWMSIARRLRKKI